MDTSRTVKSTQEQAVAAWVDCLKQLRLDELAAKLAQQDINLEDALRILSELKLGISDLIESNRGGTKGIHGFIAERVQVAFENTRSIIQNLNPEYILLDDNGPVDYLRNNTLIQAKFYISVEKTIEAIKKHLETYPDYIKNGGVYQIPEDQHADLQRYLNMTTYEGGHLTNETGRRAYVLAQELQESNGITSSDIEPAVVNRRDVEIYRVDDTINRENENIKKTDRERREIFYIDSKPTLKEGIKVTAASAAIEGGMSFFLGVYRKLKSGKKLYQFTGQDWKEVGLDTTKGTGKGAIRGATIYTLTNFTRIPAAVASAMVTASFGIVAQAQLMHKGGITAEEFILNSEIICLDVTVSAIASMMGQVLIPVPVLGAVIGNTVGLFMYSIAKDHLSRQEQILIHEFNESIQLQNEHLEAQFKEFVIMLEQEYAKFKSLTEFAFDEDVNNAFAGSVALAQYVGCLDEKILNDDADIDAFFLA